MTIKSDNHVDTFMESRISHAKSSATKRMPRLRHNNKGQFVIIVALLIATLTLATAFSVHEINVHRQSITYRPVDEFLLGTTSDMNRALTFGLKTFTTDLENNMNDSVAMQDGLNFMRMWNESMLTSYSSYGLRINSPFKSYFEYDWSGDTSYSSALLTYDFDVDSYGFIGWAGMTYKYVQLNLDAQPDFSLNQTLLNFRLLESIIGQTDIMPVSSLPYTPDPANFKLFKFTPPNTFTPITSPLLLSYQGNGYYEAIFKPALNLTLTGLKLDLSTPQDGIWVSARLIPGSGGRIIYLFSPTNNPTYGNLTRTLSNWPTGSKLNAPLSWGQINMTLYLVDPFTYNLTMEGTANARFYLTASQAVPNMNISLGFLYNGSSYKIGSAIIRNVPRTLNIILETCVINIASVQVPDFPAQTIPAGSVIWLTIFVPTYNGRLTLFYGQGTQSRIQF